MSKLDLFKGLKVKVFTSDSRTKVGVKNGVITDVTNDLIVVTFKDVNYRESFNVGVVLSENNIDVKVEGNWISLKTLLRS